MNQLGTLFKHTYLHMHTCVHTHSSLDSKRIWSSNLHKIDSSFQDLNSEHFVHQALEAQL